jgi:hypothetical protein
MGLVVFLILAVFLIMSMTDYIFAKFEDETDDYYDEEE